MNKDIRTLLAALADGNISALGEIYSMLSVRIFNYARAIVKSKEMSEDITHDVFMQILKQASRLTDIANPVAYIMTITRNQAYNHLKRVKRTALHHDEIYDASPFDAFLIEDALSRLPAKQRETVYLNHVCGYTQKEVSGIMGVPLATVKWRCGKAMSQLREYFKQNEEEKYNEI